MSAQSEDTSAIRAIDDSGRQYVVTLPAEAALKLSSGDRWRGRVSIAPSSNGSGRQGAITEQISNKSRYRNVVRATVDERKVIRAWNRSQYIRNQERSTDRESRNYPLPFRKITQTLPLVRKVLRGIGVVETIRNMETYFDFCSTGGHIWEGRNHGYKTLTGFLEKLLVYHKGKERPWWDVRDTPSRVIHDENARLTNRIANSFAQTFMDEEKFPLEEGSKQHHHFMQAATQMVRYIARKKRQGIELSQTAMIQHLLEFVQEMFENEGDPVYPAHLSSEAVWSVLPEFLSEKGVI